MADEERSEKKIKVVDRRWMTDTGEPRREPQPTTDEGAERQAKDPAPTPPDRSPAGRDTGAGQPETGRSSSRPEAQPPAPTPDVNFLTLVDFLAQQALVLLSGAHGIERNPSQAKVFIDFLGILNEKTRGTLTAEEGHALSDVLFQLRTLYVQSKR